MVMETFAQQLCAYDESCSKEDRDDNILDFTAFLSALRAPLYAFEVLSNKVVVTFN